MRKIAKSVTLQDSLKSKEKEIQSSIILEFVAASKIIVIKFEVSFV
jgi:hypothetical protein